MLKQGVINGVNPQCLCCFKSVHFTILPKVSTYDLRVESLGNGPGQVGAPSEVKPSNQISERREMSREGRCAGLGATSRVRSIPKWDVSEGARAPHPLQSRGVV